MMTTSSNGKQPKYVSDNVYYKYDYQGNEGLAEVLVSRFLDLLVLNNRPAKHAVYLPFKDNRGTGCKSKNFLSKPAYFMSLDNILYNMFGHEPYKRYANMSVVDSYNLLCTDLNSIIDFEQYSTLICFIDRIVLNVDRHMNNIGFVMNKGTIKPAPLFDFGRSLGVMCDARYTYKDIITSFGFNSVYITNNFDDAYEIARRRCSISVQCKRNVIPIGDLFTYYPASLIYRTCTVLALQVLKYMSVELCFDEEAHGVL